MTEENLKEIQKTINYTFKNPMLLQQAFVRKSFAEENPDCQDNEVLEFYGDSALNTYITMVLYDNFKGFEDGQFSSKKDQGELTKLRSRNSDKECLSHCIEILGFEQYLLLGKSDWKNKVWESRSVKEDLFEAIIGAIAIDCGWDWQQIYQVCRGMLILYNFEDNEIEELEFYCKENGYKDPEYSVEDYKKKGSLANYIATVMIEGVDRTFFGKERSALAAKMLAAQKANNYLVLQDMIEEVGKPDKENAVSQLHELFQKDFIEEPEYTFEETHDENGNPIWHCTCDFDELKPLCEAVNSSKKEVKKIVSYKALCQLMDSRLYEDDLEDSDLEVEDERQM